MFHPFPANTDSVPLPGSCRWASRLTAARLAWALFATLLAGTCCGPVTIGPVTMAAADEPLWRLGIPTFGGSDSVPELSPEVPTVDPTADTPVPAGTTPSMELPVPAPPTVEQYSGVQYSVAQYQDTQYQDTQYAPPLDSELPATLQLPAAPPETVGSGAAVQDVQSVIGQVIESGESIEPAPLEEETASWYTIPWQWVTQGWTNHAELGLDGSSGNAQTLAFQTGVEMKRKTDAYTLSLDFDYRKASNRSVTTEDNGRLNIDYDRMLNDSRWSGFGKFGMEWDQFKAFDLRLNMNGGLGYHFVRTDDALLAARFGAGASREIGAPDDSWKPEAVFGGEAEYQLNRYNKMKGKVDYFPAWEDFGDYRVVTDAAWEILLDDSDNLSLKLAVTDRYDSTPQGAKPNDVYYSMLLLVKF